VIVGEFDGTTTRRVEAIAAAFREAGADAQASPQINLELWRKFVFITSLAAGCGLARAPLGHLQATPLGRRLLERAIREVVTVGRGERNPLPCR
jgi:2-dehydropantoate 2-reductase